jgi:mannosyl-3-phosphoglycerate phosphatase
VLGTPHHVLVQDLAAIARDAGATLLGFADLDVETLARLTGLAPEDAARAAEREYDEPFLLDDPDRLPAVEAAARRRGLTVVRGGRFLHLTGPADKGTGVRVVLDALRRVPVDPLTIGLGDAPNDAPFLALVDQPVLIPRTSAGVDPELAAAVPHARRAPAAGPAGWNAVVLALLDAARPASADGEDR